MKKTCKYCGTEFQSLSIRHNCCGSRSCINKRQNESSHRRGKSKPIGSEVICKNCGVTYIRERNSQFTCSTKCYNEYRANAKAHKVYSELDADHPLVKWRNRFLLMPLIAR